MSDRSSIIIAGMHRSHTSLVAHGFHEAGLYLGDDLIGAAPSNPYGHFESQAIVDFHKRMIKEHGLSSKLSFINRSKANALANKKTFQDAASVVLESKFSIDAYSLFGWKDPRTPFFLEGWHQVLPDAYYVFVVRHPVQCVRSLNHRTRKNAGRSFFPFLSTRHFNLWDATNLCILDFVKRYPERSIVIHAPDDLVDMDQVAKMNDKIINNWGVNLKPVSFEKVIDKSLLSKTAPAPKLEKQYQRRSKTKALYEELIALSKR